MVFIDQHLVVVLSGSRVASGLDMPLSKGEYVVMFKFAAGLLGILTLLLLLSYSSHAQQAEAPVYKDGDWWRVKVDVVRPPGVSVAGPQLGRLPEYIVKFESGKPKVIGIEGNLSKETDSPGIIGLVLGLTGWRGDLLRFPMRVGLNWSDRFQYQPRGLPPTWEEGRYQVEAWEKIRTLKGEFDAFKLIMTMSVRKGPKPQAPIEVRTNTYYYAPDVKAIVSFHEAGGGASLTSTLIDFNLEK
jgi:hypothetical protein